MGWPDEGFKNLAAESFHESKSQQNVDLVVQHLAENDIFFNFTGFQSVDRLRIPVWMIWYNKKVSNNCDMITMQLSFGR